MVSKTAMLGLVKGLRWRDVREALASNPALIDVRDKRGRNWLHLACGVDITTRAPGASRDSVKTAEVLLSCGLDINEPAFTEGNWKATPLWYAVAFGKNHNLAGFLLERGSDPNHCLHAAVFNNDVAAIRLLVKNGAAIDPDVEDGTPFFFGIQWSRFAGALEMLKHGANPNYQNSKGVTALHCMLKKGCDTKYISAVLKHRARVDIPNRQGLTAAAIMTRKKDPAYRRLLAALPAAAAPSA